MEVSLFEDRKDAIYQLYCDEYSCYDKHKCPSWGSFIETKDVGVVMDRGLTYKVVDERKFQLFRLKHGI